MLSVLSIPHLFRAISENVSPRPQGEVGENSSDTGRANSTPGKAHSGTAFQQSSSAQPRPDDSAVQRCAWLS